MVTFIEMDERGEVDHILVNTIWYSWNFLVLHLYYIL
jgi:hypothetical protein